MGKMAQKRLATPPSKKLIVDMPADLPRSLKLYAVQNDRTIREIVIEAIEATISGKSRTKRKKG